MPELKTIALLLFGLVLVSEGLRDKDGKFDLRWDRIVQLAFGDGCSRFVMLLLGIALILFTMLVLFNH